MANTLEKLGKSVKSTQPSNMFAGGASLEVSSWIGPQGDFRLYSGPVVELANTAVFKTASDEDCGFESHRGHESTLTTRKY